MVRLLIHGVYIADVDGSIRGPGFIYIRDGAIQAVGEGEPPEELSLAELVLGGDNRLAMPGFASPPVLAELYGFRFLSDERISYASIAAGGGCLLSLLSDIDEEEAYYSALMWLYEAALNGVSRPVIVTANPRAAARASEAAEMSSVILVPLGCRGVSVDKPIDALDSIPSSARLRRGVLVCEGEPPSSADLDVVVRLSNGKLLAGNTAVDVSTLTPEPWVSPWSLIALGGEAVYKVLVSDMHRLVDSGYEAFQGQAHVQVVDLTEPPGWAPQPAAAKPWRLGSSRPRIETLLSGGRLVVDNGEHLALGVDAAGKAARVLAEAYDRLGSCRREGGG
ncbi:hypothetical protein [Hyperthermus butylicus]|uniref:Amidohydrolase n=1 Tax=Hyperthermus butylicus (strain DSM 5456 / JCM 9403 / PLM1-5) TaxID=415426 RepID=A2BLQ7_HYPBU|nr:hypothetical protein [Hyperthermus butylicus]ABM80918.1 hypothetical protein Hbut_1075 [Hyperthermus butylicus DSM 5456]